MILIERGAQAVLLGFNSRCPPAAKDEGDFTKVVARFEDLPLLNYSVIFLLLIEVIILVTNCKHAGMNFVTS